MESYYEKCEQELRETLSSVPKIVISSDDTHIGNFVTTLKTKSENFTVCNRALTKRKRQNGSVCEATELAKVRFTLVHGDSTEAIYLLNARLVI